MFLNEYNLCAVDLLQSSSDRQANSTTAYHCMREVRVSNRCGGKATSLVPEGLVDASAEHHEDKRGNIVVCNFKLYKMNEWLKILHLILKEVNQWS